MKRIIFSVLFASVALLAADAASVYKSGLLLPPKGDVIYDRQCASCHGSDGKQTSFKGSAVDIKYAPIAGWEVAKMSRELLRYKSGKAEESYVPVNKTGYGALMRSATKDLSVLELNAVAKYVNGLK
ncbi:MAG: c-type cytochrome [Sulfurimonas sp.]